MTHPNVAKRERIMELGPGLAIWRVHIDTIREQTSVHAITTGSERITARLMDETGYRSPTERRRVVV